MCEKIMFFVSNLNGGGAQRTIVNLVNNLNRKKYQPILVVLNLDDSQPYYNLISKDVKIINLNRRSRSSVLKIAKLLKKEKPQSVLSTLIQVNIVVAIAHKVAKSDAKLILRETNHRKRNQLSFMTYRLIKWAYNYCDLVVALSKGVSNDIRKLYEVDKRKIVIIYNPIDIEFIKKKGDEKLLLPESSFKMVTCGRLEEQKNYQLLINSLAKYDEINQDWTLHILGEGSQEEVLKDKVKQLGLEKRIYFEGFQKNPYKYMKNADLFVLTSKWEGFGHVIVEAMATGTPVLSSNCPHGPEEILNKGEYGWLFKNDSQTSFLESLKGISCNKSNLTELRKVVLERAEEYNLRTVVAEYEKLFKSKGIIFRSEKSNEE